MNAVAPPRATAPGVIRWDTVNLLGRDDEAVEVVALLKRRNIVTRRREQYLKVRETYAVLSNCTAAELRLVEYRVAKPRRGVGSADHVPLRTLTSRGWSAVGVSGVACAVVLAQKLTRRPMAGLTALATRYLLQGHAWLVEVTAP